MLRRGILRWTVLAFISVALACAGAADLSVDSQPPDGPEELLRLKAAILRAEDLRVIDDRVRGALTHPAGEIRARAARALGRIGDPTASEQLEDRLRDAEPGVRAEAAFALGLIGDRSAVPALLRAARDAEGVVRARAADALGLLGDADSAEDLLALLRDDAPEVTAAASLAVQRVGQPARTVETLLQILDSRGGSPPLPILRALVHLVTSSRVLRPALRMRARDTLVALAGSEHAEVRMLVAQGLAVPLTREEAETLGVLLRDRDVRVRIFAVEGLGFPGASPEPHISRALQDTDYRVVLAALRALSNMRGPEVDEALAGFVIHDQRDWLRRRAIWAMGRANPDSAARMANGLSKSKEATLREETARLLYGRRDAPALRIALRLVQDPIPQVRAAAIPALAGAGGKLSSLLINVVDENNPAIRGAIADVVRRRLEDPTRKEDDRQDALEVLQRILAPSRPEPDPYVWRAILDAAAGGSDLPGARAILEQGLSASVRDVRLHAIELLRQRFGEERSEAAGPASDRSLDDYVEILRWAEQPRAAIITVQRPGYVSDHFTVRLDTDSAPLTAWNFARLANRGFYDELEIYRLVPNFLVQGGDPHGDGTGSPGHTIRDEPGPTRFPAGTLGMASEGRDRASCQWFITLTDHPQLMGRHTSFGTVIQNFPGVVSLLVPGDRVLSVKVYEGDGTETLPPPGTIGSLPGKDGPRGSRTDS